MKYEYYGWDDGTALYHYGILGMKWGVRRWQNPDGTFNEAGKKRYGRVSKNPGVARIQRSNRVLSSIKRGTTPFQWASTDDSVKELMRNHSFQLHNPNNPRETFNRYDKMLKNDNYDAAKSFAKKSLGKEYGKLTDSDLVRLIKDPGFASEYENLMNDYYYEKLIRNNAQYKALNDSANKFDRDQTRMIRDFIKDKYALGYGMGLSEKRDREVSKYIEDGIRAVANSNRITEANRLYNRNILLDNTNAKYDERQDAWFDKKTGRRLRG